LILLEEVVNFHDEEKENFFPQRAYIGFISREMALAVNLPLPERKFVTVDRIAVTAEASVERRGERC
jgi:hypothetical protein